MATAAMLFGSLVNDGDGACPFVLVFVEDEDDYEAHFNYIHYNPVKHKLVKCPRDWESTSFQRWVKQGVYPADWGCSKFPITMANQI